MINLEENEAFNKLLSLNPQKGKSFLDAIKIIKTNKRNIYKFKLYSWIGKTRKSTEYPKDINIHLKRLGFNMQIYYDIVVLGLTDISQRPKCPICGKVCEFLGTHYSKFCNDNNCKKFKRKVIKISNINNNIKDEEAFINTLKIFNGNLLNLKDILIKKDKLLLPKYIINKFPELPKEIKTCFLNKWFKHIGITVQTFFDVFILGLTDISQRPKCPICGKVSKFINLSNGYLHTCGSLNCIKEINKI